MIFDFNALADEATNGTVQTHMRSILTDAGMGSVTVTGAKGERNYTGDGHVVGPMNGNNVATALTLGNSNNVPYTYSAAIGAWDTYLVNKDSVDRITMIFTRPVYGVSFDYEIFPNAECEDAGRNGCPTAPASGSRWPDFKLIAGGSLIFERLGLDPQDNANGMAYRESPISDGPVWGFEKAPQRLDVSGWWTLPGVYKLEFVDWPSRIGIDNLSVTFVPEPGTFALLALGFAGLWLRRRWAA